MVPRLATALPADEDAEVVDAAGMVLMPGLVDTHVHVNEPGRTEWEGFATATAAARRGGVSVIVDKVSMQFVFGSEVDFVDDLIGASFKIDNPVASAACGCGTSFSI